MGLALVVLLFAAGCRADTAIDLAEVTDGVDADEPAAADVEPTAAPTVAAPTAQPTEEPAAEPDAAGDPDDATGDDPTEHRLRR